MRTSPASEKPRHPNSPDGGEYVNPKERRLRCAELYTVRGWTFGKIHRATGAALSQLSAWKMKYGWAQALIPPSRIRYPEPQRAAVLATLEATGSLAETSRQTLIPKRTIGRWRDAKPVKDALPAMWRCYGAGHEAFGRPVQGAVCPVCRTARWIVP